MPDPNSLVRILKLLLKDPHQSVSSAALTFVPTLVTHLRNNLDPQSDLVHAVKSIVTTLLPIILERCGDSKDRIRESAASALEEIGRAAIDSSPNQLGSSLRAKASEGPLELFEGLVRESGLMGKSAKIREQVSEMKSIQLRGRCRPDQTMLLFHLRRHVVPYLPSASTMPSSPSRPSCHLSWIC